MTLSITVLGLVQGVGYRPFVARLARELGIEGTVRNSGGIVHILARGDKPSLDLFTASLSTRCPSAANVTQVMAEQVDEISLVDETAPSATTVQSEDTANIKPHAIFSIIESESETTFTPVLPADLPMCEACGKELADPVNRRFSYPFISCVDCGPRYSIMKDIPYDRANITMDAFPLCPSCEAEYQSDNRRSYAQTISCHDCGPQLILKTDTGTFHKEDALTRAICLLKEGSILAIKGIGGYQFACKPDLAETAQTLRLLKGRDRKPFAVMFPDMTSIEETCRVSDSEKKLLLSDPRPIVLLAARENSFCAEVNGESRFQGAFLPYTALHQLLTDACGPLIMTSANLSDEPIIFRDESILNSGLPSISGVLYNEREIVTPLDDSVARVAAGRTQLIRRSRGFVPMPILLTKKTLLPILSYGGDLKGSFCVLAAGSAYLSQYFGDLEIHAVKKNFEENMKRMLRLFRVTPEYIACDLHPKYISADLASRASEVSGIQLVKVQHHHAHVASVMAEHGLDSCIGVAFDGTGYGTDGAVWGSEFLLCEGARFTREAHLSYVTLCGGDSSAKKADLVASCYLAAAGETIRHADEAIIRAALNSAALNSASLWQKSLTYESGSMGRLFDAVSSTLGICRENTYEGECAILLENAAARALAKGIKPYPLSFKITRPTHGFTAPITAFTAPADGQTANAHQAGTQAHTQAFAMGAAAQNAISPQIAAATARSACTQSACTTFDQISLLAEIFHAKENGRGQEELALGFHIAIAEMVVEESTAIREKSGEKRVALSGGVFANALLAEMCVNRLETAGFSVYLNEAIPGNDGGICLGQAWVCSQIINEKIRG